MSEPTASTGFASYRRLVGDIHYMTILAVTMTGSLTGNLLSAALPGLAAAFDVSNAHIGLAVTAYALPSVFSMPFSGVLADLYGRRTVIIPAMLVYGTAGIAIAFADSYALVLVLLGLQGLASAGLGPLTITLLGDLYSGAEGVTAQGGRVAANKINNIAIPTIVGFLLGVHWNVPFFLYAIPFATAIVAYIYLPAPIDPDQNAKGFRETIREYVVALRFELTDRTLALLVSGGGARDFVKNAVIPFVPLFAVQSLGASYVAAGAVLSARGVSGLFAAPLAGSLLAVLSRKQIMVIAFGINALCIALMPAATDVFVLTGLVAGFGIGDAIFAATIKDSVTAQTSDEYRAGVISSMMTLKRLSKSLAPAFFGLVLGFAGFTPLFLIAAAIAVGYGLLIAVALPSKL